MTSSPSLDMKRARNGKSLNAGLEDLRQTCAYLQLSTQGSKAELQGRIKDYTKKGHSTVASCLLCHKRGEEIYCLNCRFANLEPYNRKVRIIQVWHTESSAAQETSLLIALPPDTQGLELRCLQQTKTPEEDRLLFVEAWPATLQLIRSDTSTKLDVKPRCCMLPKIPGSPSLRIVLPEMKAVSKLVIALVEVAPGPSSSTLKDEALGMKNEIIGRAQPSAVQMELFRKQFLATTDRVDVNFRCPYTIERVKTPVRSKHCIHPRCFDLDTHLEICANMYQTGSTPYSRRWMCPECQKSARLSELYIDSFVAELLQQHAEKEAICISSNLEPCEKVSIVQ